MSMFKKLFGKPSQHDTKKSSVNLNDNKVIYEQKYSQSHSFRGYKRFIVSYYGYEPAEKGLARFKESGQNLEGADIVLKFVKRGQSNFVDVQVNNYLIGSITMWNDDDAVLDYFKNVFCSGKVTKAHIRIESETIMTTDKRGRKIQDESDRIYLFLKSEE